MNRVPGIFWRWGLAWAMVSDSVNSLTLWADSGESRCVDEGCQLPLRRIKDQEFRCCSRKWIQPAVVLSTRS